MCGQQASNDKRFSGWRCVKLHLHDCVAEVSIRQRYTYRARSTCTDGLCSAAVLLLQAASR
jgi:hypothetical protein